jgi:hypothetical protein
MKIIGLLIACFLLGFIGWNLHVPVRLPYRSLCFPGPFVPSLTLVPVCFPHLLLCCPYPFVPLLTLFSQSQRLSNMNITKHYNKVKDWATRTLQNTTTKPKIEQHEHYKILQQRQRLSNTNITNTTIKCSCCSIFVFVIVFCNVRVAQSLALL